MSLIQWKQIDTDLKQDGILTGSLFLSGSFFLNDIDILQEIEQSSIFKQTGSFWNTSRNVGITGSFSVNLSSIEEDVLEISVDQEPKLEVNKEGILRLIPQSITPTPVDGGIFYSGSKEFFVGL